MYLLITPRTSQSNQPNRGCVPKRLKFQHVLNNSFCNRTESKRTVGSVERLLVGENHCECFFILVPTHRSYWTVSEMDECETTKQKKCVWTPRAGLSWSCFRMACSQEPFRKLFTMHICTDMISVSSSKATKCFAVWIDSFYIPWKNVTVVTHNNSVSSVNYVK